MPDKTSIDKLLWIMAQLRDEKQGCPWDREQTYQSLTPYTLEEVYEVIETIEQDDLLALPGELGDLLFQIVFYAQLGKEQSRFDFDDVVTGICDKLIRRHPHVFADEQVTDAEEQTRAWEEHKAKERAQQGQSNSLLDGVSSALPAMTRAIKLQKRAARVGFDWPDIQGVVEKVHEELAEVQQALSEHNRGHIRHELGDLLFSCVNLVRHAKLDPEQVLREANNRFKNRFLLMEQAFSSEDELKAASLDEMERTWQSIKPNN